jgi:ribose-phosphate pyrophosphokinase
MKYKITTYPDGGQYATITHTSANVDILNEKLVYRINNYTDLFMLKSIKDAWDNLKRCPLHLTIPCMFQQQHDRRFNIDESYELKLVCEFINSCNFESVSIFHPHNESAISMALNNVKYLSVNYYYANIFKSLEEKFKVFVDNKPILLSTDAGSFKWVNKIAERFELDLYAANKMREKDKLTQSIDCQDFKGRDIIVCDDLCVYGGTFVGLAKMLKERNCGKLFLIVSHMTVKNPNKELENLYDAVYATNSKYDEYDLKNIIIDQQFSFN